MTAPVTAAIPVSVGGGGPPRADSSRGVTFHQVLSALNPLQYLPLVGTIYRAVTGDTIPEPVRRIGSLIFSGLIGGPVGMAITLLTTAAEKITGIDLDRTGQALLHRESLAHAVTAQRGAAKAGAAAGAGRSPPAHDALVASKSTQPKAPQPWSAAQLAAYGVRTDLSGTLLMTGLHGADVLNALEMTRLQAAKAAYAQTTTLGS